MWYIIPLKFYTELIIFSHRSVFFFFLIFKKKLVTISASQLSGLKPQPGTSLVAQWLRICLPMQRTWVRALVWEDPSCHGATKPVHHNYQAHVLQLLKPAHLEPVLHNKRSHHNEKPSHDNKE